MDNQLFHDLKENSLLHGIDKSLFESVVSAMQQQTVAADEIIFKQGDDASTYYFIAKGAVEVRDRDNPVNTLGTGEGFGELALLSGQPRTATVIAKTDTTLLQMSRKQFTQLAQTNPVFAERLHALTRHNLRRQLLASAMMDIIGEVDTDIIQLLEDKLIWHTYQAGETIFRQGDPGDKMLIILTGRVRVTHHDGETERILGEQGRNTLIGELALLSNQQRAATIIAIRGTSVVEINQSFLEELISRFPSLAKRLMSIIAQRQQQNLESRAVQQPTSLNFTLVPTHPNVDMDAFIRQLQPYLEKHGTVYIVRREDMNAFYGVNDVIAQVPKAMFQQRINELEETYDYVMFVADDTHENWAHWIVKNADRVLLVGKSDNDPAPRPFERRVIQESPHQRHELILLHPPETIQPSGTAAWLTPRDLFRHHHIRQTDDSHYARVARILTGNGIGLVLGGGGARGYAHIGIIKAMYEAQIPVDAIGSVSMGAVIGGAMLSSLSTDDVAGAILASGKKYGSKKALLDTTIPISAMMRSKKVSKAVHGICGDLNIEDGWVPFYCISTNLTQYRLNIHRHGKLHRAVRASLSIPGVFSPVVRDGDLVVDGGVMNNFPVDIMRNFLEGGTIIGSVVQGEKSKRTYEIQDDIDGIRMFFSRFIPWMQKKRVPSIIKTIMAASSVNAYAQQPTYRKNTDFLLETVTTPYGSLDFDDIWELVNMGYERHKDTIQQWADEHQNTF